MPTEACQLGQQTGVYEFDGEILDDMICAGGIGETGNCFVRMILMLIRFNLGLPQIRRMILWVLTGYG